MGGGHHQDEVRGQGGLGGELPGAVGGFLGALVLTNISLASAKAGMSSLLIFFGYVILARFGLGLRLIPVPKRGIPAR